MKKVNKILVATDFSKQSDCAILLAHDIQKKFGAVVTLVHISDVSPVWDWPATDTQAKNLLGQFQKEITSSLDRKMEEQVIRCGVNFEGMVTFGTTQKELIKEIESTRADLLVMGHRGQTGFFGVGSFAEKMIASSPIPVLIAKNNKTINNITCLVDPSKVSEDSITYTKNFAHAFNGKAQYMTFISDLSSDSLNTVPFLAPTYKFSEEEKSLITEKAKSFILEQIKDISESDIHIEISNLRTAKALARGLVEKKADLVVVSRHNRGPIEKFFIGSTSKGILQEFDGNILVL